MKVLVTGADGFVGRYLVPRLIETGHSVSAGCRPGGEPLERWLPADYRRAVQIVPLELSDAAVVQAALRAPYDAIVHLAAVASGSEARQDPARAWAINAAGTARLLQAAGESRTSGKADPLVLVVSTAEVYGGGPPVSRTEEDPLYPESPYAASKVGAEVVALEAWRGSGIRVIIARPFQHTGPGQSPQYVVPAYAYRLRMAKANGQTRVPTGNLHPVRDLLDVRDVVEAYIGLLAHGVPGEAYNISRGEGVSLRDLFDRIAALVGVEAEPFLDPALVRAGDNPHLVGDWTKLRRATGWCPTIALDQTLRELVDAQAH